MKRDMDLIRKILMILEEKESAIEKTSPTIDSYSKELISWHYEILHNAGLIQAEDRSDTQRHHYWVAGNLTWDGCEFLDNAKNDKVWNKTKEIVKKHGGGFSIEVLKKLLTKVAMETVFKGI